MLSASTRRVGSTRRPLAGKAESRPWKGDGLKEQARAYVRQLKREYPICFDCRREWPPYVLEFDHVDPETKSFNVGDASSVPSMEALIAEAEKCDLVCSNCHKIREHERSRRRRQGT